MSFFSFWPFKRTQQTETTMRTSDALKPESMTEATLSPEKPETVSQPKEQQTLQTPTLPQTGTPLTLENLQETLDNLRNQLEAYINLQLFFSQGQLLPPFHGWPISPDFAVQLIRLIQKTPYEAIFEFGSGSSTVIIAKALQVFERTQTLHAVFEHKSEFLEKTRMLLPPAAQEQSQLYFTPLVPYKETVDIYKYYDCAKVLAELAAKLKDTEPCRILCLVDGPPGFTCKNARYPVLSHLLAAFSKLRYLDILLDDYKRNDEQETGQKWRYMLEAKGFRIHQEILPLEKGALLFQARK